MKVELIPLENRVLKIVVEATPEETEEARRIAAQKLGKRVHIPGFRPGKAPYPILIKHLDPIALQEETIEVFLNQHYPEILEKENIEPSGSGRLESIINIEPIKLEIHTPLKPLVELGDYYSIRIPYEPPVIQDEDVERALEGLRRQNAVIEPVNRPIQEGDIAYIDLIGYRIENGNKTEDIVTEQRDIPIQINSDDQDTKEAPFEGFSRLLIGKQANEQLSVAHSFPEDTLDENLKGLDVHFEIRVKEVKAQRLPELNDEFVHSVGEFNSLEELKNFIRTELEQKALTDYHKEYDKKALDELIQSSRIEYTLDLVEKERAAYLEELNQNLSRLKLDLDLYKKILGEERFEKELEEAVLYRLKASLTLLELAKKENIQIDLERVKKDTQQVMHALLNTSLAANLSKKKLEEVATGISTDMMFSQVYENTYKKLRQIAKGEIDREDTESTQEYLTEKQPDTPLADVEESTESAMDIQSSSPAEEGHVQPIEFNLENKE